MSDTPRSDEELGQASTDADLSAPGRPADTLEGMLADVVRAPPALKSGDELVGRYKIEKLIGAGGMGAVYRAHDATLERTVAIKLHHAGSAERLKREAVAMARLAHPNVVTVFEAGSIGEQGFVAMEYVAGVTLRAWLGAKPRTRRARLDVLFAAGAGLAAAHDAGLIHRDFKPENVLIGDDGRVRVGDFGLARGSQSHDDGERVTAPPPDGTLATPLTRADAVIGTPAYMAPEQARGEAVDARADQFAFCIVAWEVLCGERPFADTDRATLRPPPPRTLTARVRRVLETGLEREPSARYPDLHALLAALRVATRPRRALVVAAAAPVFAAAAALYVHAHPAEAACDGAGDELAAAIPADLIAATRASGASDAAARFEVRLSDWKAMLRKRATQVCRERRDGALSPELYARATSCLSIAAHTAVRMLAVDELPPGGLAMASYRFDTLPESGYCADPALLAGQPQPTSEPVRRTMFEIAYAELDAARREIDMGTPARARALVDDATRLGITDDPKLATRAAIVRAGLLFADGKPKDAVAAYEAAYYQARKIDDIDVALDAATAVIARGSDAGLDDARVEQWIQLAIADAERVEKRLPSAVATVYWMAAARTAERDPERAEGWIAKALPLIGTQASTARSEMLATAGQIACALHRVDECIENDRAAIAMAREISGEGVRLANMLNNVANDFADAGRASDAIPLARDAVAIGERTHASDLDLATSRMTLGRTLIDGGGSAAEAHVVLAAALPGLASALGNEHDDVLATEILLARAEARDGAADSARVRIARVRGVLAKRGESPLAHDADAAAAEIR